MEREISRYKLYSRRVALLAGAKLTLLAVLAGRTYHLQVVEAEQFKLLAEENRVNVRLLAPPRGRILDRHGNEIAINRQNFRVVLVPEQAGDVEETLNRLGNIVEVSDHQRRRIARDIQRQRPFMPITVVEHLTWQEFAKVNVNLPDLPGSQPDVGETRYYPYGDKMSHVVGYVAAVSEKDLNGDPLLELPGFRIGKNGVEKVHDTILRGKAGNSRVEVNAFGRIIRELARKDGERGDDVALTVDVGLQSRISEMLGDESASAIVMDVHNGEVLAMVSNPAFDPNVFSMGLSNEVWQGLLNNPRNPLVNKSVAGQYPPGSTFKMVVALAALEAGVVPSDHLTFCNGRTRLGRHNFHCWSWRYGGHGWLDMRQALEQSCDIFFYDIAKRVGVDRIAAMARRLGFGEQTNISLTGERSGLIPTKAWKLATVGEPWQTGETLNVGIGQGQVLATPLQLAVMTARLVNGGRRVEPHLIRAIGGKTLTANTAPESIGLSPHILKRVVAGMGDVVNGKKGTARRAKLANDINWGGKTGSAQVRRITKKERTTKVLKNEEKPWEERDHGLFVGFAPLEAPKYAIALVIEHYGSGSKTALKASEIMNEVMARDPAQLAGDAGQPLKTANAED